MIACVGVWKTCGLGVVAVLRGAAACPALRDRVVGADSEG
jgi:hypothetical protein